MSDPKDDTISTSSWVAPAGGTEETNQATTTQATIKLSAGTVGESYLLTNIITTTNSQETAERSTKVRIVEHKYN